MTHDIERRGSCLCGAVRLTLKTGTAVAACHCSMCRKWGGGPFLSVEHVSAVRFEGEEHITVFGSSDWAERGFCSRCGSHLFYRLKKPVHYAVPLGVIDGGADWNFEQQIFIDEKPAFYSFAERTKNLTGAEVFAQFAPPAQ